MGLEDFTIQPTNGTEFPDDDQVVQKFLMIRQEKRGLRNGKNRNLNDRRCKTMMVQVKTRNIILR